MSVVNNNLLLAADAGVAPTAYQISRSLRFNNADSAYLNRTPTVAGNRKTWTWAGWVKRSALVSGGTFNNAMIFSAGASNPGFVLAFDKDSRNDAIQVNFTRGSNAGNLTSALFRDFSAWFHLCLAFDTTQATASDRVKIWINGVQQTWAQNVFPTQNADYEVNNTSIHNIGRASQSSSEYINAYLADVHFIDGQALTPSSFTETDANGELQPKLYTGTYGTNGFRLNFSDNSAATAATLGADSSGNGNNWTPNNLSVNAGGQVSISAASGALPVYNTTDAYGAVKGTGTRTDSNASSLVLAIPMDGANNGTTFTDESANIRGSGSAKAITRFGDTKTLTAQSKFYGSSGFFDGTGDYLSIPDSADFDLGTSNFTIEGFVYVTATSGSLQTLIAKGTGADNQASYDIALTTGGTWVYYLSGNGSTWSIASAITIGTNVLNTWQHIALVRNGSTFTPYFNGVAGTPTTSSTALFDSNKIFSVGADDTGNSRLTGYIQDLRIYKGVAKYTANFTPPSATQNTTVAAGCDSLTDTPTSYGTDTGAGGEVRGNYATLNPLSGSSLHTLSNGNLEKVSTSGSGNRFGTIGITSGKFYWENAFTVIGFGVASCGISSNGRDANDISGLKIYETFGTKYNGSSSSSYGASWGSNIIIGVAFDADNGTLVFYRNGVSQGTAFTGLTGQQWFPVFRDDGGYSGWINFGQRPFAYAAPSGFKALCDTNLPAPTIAKGSSAMDVLTWTGNSASSRSFTGLGFSPDFVWIKDRVVAYNHVLFDAVRGTGGSKVLFPHRTTAEGGGAGEEGTNYGAITSFDSNGFTVAPGAVSSIWVNQSSDAYVGWAWDAGSTTVTNTAGTITSQVRANSSAGFSVVTYTGTGANATVGHGLGVAPSMVIVKRRDTTGNWQVRHVSIAAANSIQLNLANAAAAATTVWNSTAPSSTVFSIGASTDVNASAGTYVAYCFAPVTGYSSFGSYTGNGSADGPFVYLGFRPAFLMMKRTNSTGNWVMLDSKREGYNVDNDPLYANLANVEGTDDLADITSNGFKLRTTNADCNASGGTYIYAAFAENPFQYARAR